jgi:integrase
MRYAVKAGVLERNVVRDLDRDDRPGAGRLSEPRYLSLAELQRLFEGMGEIFRPIAATCALAGLRASETLGLRWRDVDFKASTITVSGQLGAGGKRAQAKTLASVATVPLLPALAAELHTHRQSAARINLARVHGDAYIFVTRNGRPQSSRNALRAVHRSGDATGLNGRVARGPDGIEREREPVGLHDLRHSFVAVALASGLTLPEVSALARHANPKITAMAYAGLSDDSRLKLADKLAAAFEA